MLKYLLGWGGGGGGGGGGEGLLSLSKGYYISSICLDINLLLNW